MAPNVKRGKVLILGAGVSGIAAARHLMFMGFDVLVIEGRVRIFIFISWEIFIVHSFMRCC